ncbi:hypothetical protein [Streptacidiphilus anmyonensis]|uniref:hypothetical protein n=1 Tax=Streptacidiphilus anmyonensis TaxID=405782 RepID=UPI0005AA0ABD|nr:hypothetical protein [Streptacidiphilus anmyonensis]
MARWISRPERTLRRAGVVVVLIALAELATLVIVSGRDRLIMAGALVGATLSVAIMAFGIVRLRRVVDGGPCGDAAQAVQVPAAMLEGFPMDRLRPALLADPERLHLDLLYSAWVCAVLGRDAAWIAARYGMDRWVADLLVRASVDA